MPKCDICGKEVSKIYQYIDDTAQQYNDCKSYCLDCFKKKYWNWQRFVLWQDMTYREQVLEGLIDWSTQPKVIEKAKEKLREIQEKVKELK